MDTNHHETKDVLPKTRTRKQRFFQAFVKLYKEYCENSSIHGIRYLGEKKRPPIERVFWIIAIVGCLTVSIILILNAYRKWDISPVIVSLAEKSTPIWEIPFPAVTVCPITKTKPHIFNYTNGFCHLANGSLSEEQLEYMDAISQVCYYTNIVESDLQGSFGTTVSANRNIIDALERAAPNFDEVFEECYWLHESRQCSNYFERVITEEGICYTFNTIEPSKIYRDRSFYHYDFTTPTLDWTLESGFVADQLDTYPRRVFGVGENIGLFLQLLGNQTDFDYLCKESVQGYQIVLHTPGTLPNFKADVIHIPFGMEAVLKVKPSMIKTSPGLKNYKPDRRLCYFGHERKLEFFDSYTEENCRLECLTNFTLRKCKCVKFSMPRKPETPVCGAGKISCLKKAEDRLARRQFVWKNRTTDPEAPKDCNCLPTCTTISYDHSFSMTAVDFHRMNHLMECGEAERRIPRGLVARVAIYYVQDEFMTSRRSELYGLTDFLGNCGGLLGLFMGFSLLSLVEIIYYCTLRLANNIRQHLQKKKQLKAIEAAKEREARNSITNEGKD